MCLILKRFWLISSDDMRIVVEVIFLSLMVDIRIIHYMIFFHELLRIVYYNFTLTGDGPFLDVDGNFKIKVHVLDVLVEKEQATSIDLEISVGDLELFVGEKSELVLYELNSFLDPVKELGECLSFLTFLQKL